MTTCEAINNERPTAQPFMPDEAWIDAFAAQSTNDLRLDALAYAKRRTYSIGRAGAYVDAFTAEDLVQDALGDTLLGVIAWDPAAKSLRQHLEDAIRSRTRHERVRAGRFRHLRIDSAASDGERHSTLADVESSLVAERDDGDPVSAMFASEVLDRLRELAADDRLVIRILDAIVAGARGRADIMHVANLSSRTYRNARDRLGRLVAQLDSQTCAALRRA